MKKGMHIQKLTLSAMFLALAFIMPFITGQIPQIGAMLCPMHIPVLLCGFFCGGPWGFGVGLFAPIIRSAMLGMPPLFPVAFCMAFELAMYGLVAGVLHNRLPKKRLYVYASLIVAMVVGRIVWGIAMFCCLGFDLTKFENSGKVITEEELWNNYRYFIDAVLPVAEKHNIQNSKN